MDQNQDYGYLEHLRRKIDGYIGAVITVKFESTEVHLGTTIQIEHGKACVVKWPKKFTRDNYLGDKSSPNHV